MTIRAWGSSPLARGKRDEVEALREALRLIPARAGKTDCLPGDD